jgi:hypothetical protein
VRTSFDPKRRSTSLILTAASRFHHSHWSACFDASLRETVDADGERRCLAKSADAVAGEPPFRMRPGRFASERACRAADGVEIPALAVGIHMPTAFGQQ